MKLVLGRQNPTFSVAAVQLRADITYSKATVSVIIDERGLNKYARDYVSEIDHLTFVIGKGLIDYPEATETLTFDAIKAIAEYPEAVESLDRVVSYIRGYSDAVPVPDVLLGKILEKALDDTVTALEQLKSFAVTSYHSEIQPIYDNADANSGDGLEYVDVKPSSDLVGSADLTVASMGKVLADSVSALEAFVFVATKVISELVTTLEQVSLATESTVVDTYVANDAFSRVFVANIAQTDSTLTSDQLASIGVEKLLTESMNTASLGSLRMTDYVDITYLAEDYVGASTTFS